jgi:hypothetical protein
MRWFKASPLNHIANIAKIANIQSRIAGESRRHARCTAPGTCQNFRPMPQLAAALKARSKRFAIGVIVLCREFPRSLDALVVAKQLIKSSTSVAANYRAACRTRLSRRFRIEDQRGCRGSGRVRVLARADTRVADLGGRKNSFVAEGVGRADGNLHCVTGHREEKPEKGRRPLTTRDPR